MAIISHVHNTIKFSDVPVWGPGGTSAFYAYNACSVDQMSTISYI